SLGKVARERIPGELSPSNYPGRHVARDKYPQRHVARESVEMSLGIVVKEAKRRKKGDVGDEQPAVQGNTGDEGPNLMDRLNHATPMLIPAEVSAETSSSNASPDVANNTGNGLSVNPTNTTGLSSPTTGTYFKVVNKIPSSQAKKGSEQVGNIHAMNNIMSSYANKLSPTSLSKANLRNLETNVPNDTDYHFSSIEGVDSMLRDGPWMIHGIHILLNKWLPSMSFLKEELGWSSYARIFIEINACKDFSDNLVMVVPNIEVTGYTKETIRVEYEWKPPRCSTYLLFGHSGDVCPKAAPKRVENQMDKSKGQIPRADGEGIVEVKRKKSGTTPPAGTNKASTSGYNKESSSNKDYSDSDDEVEPVENETASFLESKGVGYGPKSLWGQWRDTVVDDEYDPYDDDMYEGQEIPENIQTICDNSISRLDRGLKVSDMIDNSGWMWPNDWYGKFPMITSLNVPTISTGSDDKIVWKDFNGKIKDFSVISVYHDLRRHIPTVTWWKLCPFSSDVWNRAQMIRDMKLNMNDWQRIIQDMSDAGNSNRIKSIIRRLLLAARIMEVIKYKLLGITMKDSKAVTDVEDKDDARDTLVWRNIHGNVKNFSVSQVWDDIRHRESKVNWYSMVWFPSCIPRHAINLWLIIRRKLKTQDLVPMWDVSDSLGMVCSLCESVPDSHDHLFFECPFAKGIWDRVKVCAGLAHYTPNVYVIIQSLMPIMKRRTTNSVVAKLVVAAATYYVWQERNWRLFKKGKRSPDQIVECIKSSVRLKLLSCKLKKSKNGERLARLWDLPEAVFK
ncbi:reverse transcriptase domain, reverse transcriptase zinc-binding domain protein, partial [Tanacetum coccineum]